MPWKKRKPMDKRLLFIARLLEGETLPLTYHPVPDIA